MSGKSETEKHAKQNPKPMTNRTAFRSVVHKTNTSFCRTENRKTQDVKPKTLDPKPETLLLAGPDFSIVYSFQCPVSTQAKLGDLVRFMPLQP